MSEKGKFDEDKIEEEFEFLDDDTELLDEKSFDPGKAAKSKSESSASSNKMEIPQFLQSLPNKRNIIIGVIMVVVGLGSYLLLNSSLFVKKNEFKTSVASPQPPRQTNQITLQPSQNNAHPETNNNAANNGQQVALPSKEQDMNTMKTELFEELLQSAKIDPNAPSSMEMQEAMKRMNTDIYSNSNSIMKIQYNLKEIAQAIAGINTTLSALDNKLTGVTGSIDSVNHDISGVKKVIADEDLDISSKKVIEETVHYKAPEFTVHAVIPGRAWLKDKSGKIITITEGDTLGKYGTISNIDVVRSIVATSSGTSFR